MMKIQNLKNHIDYGKKCHYHQNSDIIYLQIGELKLKQIGACIECVTSQNLSGQNLILISEIDEFLNKENVISKRYPFLEDKNILQQYQNEFLSQQYKDPLEECKQSLKQIQESITYQIQAVEKAIQENLKRQFVNKNDLLNFYFEVSQKGKLKVMFKDYMTGEDKYGQNLANFIKDLNQRKNENSQLLKEKLNGFLKTQAFIKQQSSLSQKFKTLTTNIINILGRTFTFEAKNDSFYQQAESNLDEVNGQLERIKSLFQPANQNDSQMKQNHSFQQFSANFQKDASFQLKELTESILIQEAQLSQKFQQNANQLNTDLTLTEQFKKNISDITFLYYSQYSLHQHLQNNMPMSISTYIIVHTPKTFQIQKINQSNKVNIKCLNQNDIGEIYNSFHLRKDFFFRIQLELKPFQGCPQYKFCLGVKNYNKQLNPKKQQQQQIQQQQISYFISNSQIQGRLNTSCTKGRNLLDQSNGEQNRQFEILLCLSNKKLILSEIPNKENVIVVQDARFDAINQDQRYCFFLSTENIQEIQINEFTMIPQI